ncbi:MAG TPA: radical SAM protein [bacterium]|nr:radical SAM protein [bacterium]
MKPRTLLVHAHSKRQRLNVSGFYAMPPLGIATLAGCLDRAGYPVELFDANVHANDEQFITRNLEENRFDHVGISANYFSAESALELAAIVRRRHPETLITLGGPVGLLNPARFADYTQAVDLIVHGEGEETIVDILRALEDGTTLQNIAGTTFVRGGVVERGPARKPLEMDSLPRPMLEKLPLNRYRLHPPFGVFPPGQYIESARGCPYGCSFCTLPREIRFRSPDLVVNDIADLIRRYRVREIHFVDPTFTFDRDRVIEISRGIKRLNAKLHWTCKTRCDMVDPEMLAEMAASGCYTISYGIETASQPILDFYNKEITVEEIGRGLDATRQAGIRILAYMLIGSPGETEETVRETMAMMRRYKPDFVLYAQMLPDPGSIRAREDMQKGIYTEKEMLDYYLGGKTELLDQRGVSGIPAETINRWIAMAFNDFYARPIYILRRLLDMRSIHDLLNYFRAALVLLADKLGMYKTVG